MYVYYALYDQFFVLLQSVNYGKSDKCKKSCTFMYIN